MHRPKCGLCRRAACVSPAAPRDVCQWYAHSCITSKLVNVSSSGSHAILVLSYQTLYHYFDGDLPNGSVECRWVWKKLRFSTNMRFISEIIQYRAIGTTTGTCLRPVTPPIQPSSTCQPISLIIPTLIIRRFTPGSKPTFLTNSYHSCFFYPLDCLDGPDLSCTPFYV